jgi:hypothetical protein
VLRDTFSLVSPHTFLTTWIPRSPNIVVRCADGEPYGFFLLILSFLPLYFYLQPLARRNVLMREDTSIRAKSTNAKAPEMELPALETGTSNSSVGLILVLRDFRGSCDRVNDQSITADLQHSITQQPYATPFFANRPGLRPLAIANSDS